MKIVKFVTDEINGKSLEFEITVTVEQDDTDPVGDLHFVDEKELADYLQSLHNGDFFVARIYVEASALGFSGADVLNNCPVKSYSMNDVLETVLDNDMISLALNECRANILSAAERIKHFV